MYLHRFSCLQNHQYAHPFKLIHPPLVAGQMAESKQSVISNRNLAVLGHVMGLTYYVAIDAHKIDWGKGALQEASCSLDSSPSQCLAGPRRFYLCTRALKATLSHCLCEVCSLK